MALKLYEELAEWWPLLSPPDDYEEEARFFTRLLEEAGDAPAQTLVEFGSGGGNNAFHMKRRFQTTLVEPAEGMRAVSQRLNPECEHHAGDMRTVRLGRTFDRVFLHDAICYMTTLDDLRQAIQTAYVHCRPGGAALFAPDFVRENFVESTEHGGSGSLRYLEWCYDPDPSDSTCSTDYVVVLHQPDGSTRVEHDVHVEGLFSRAEWLGLLVEAGFAARPVPFEHSELEPDAHEVFLAVRR